MGKVIILEGPDGSGKTTLARKLESLGWEYRHEGPPPNGVAMTAHYLTILIDSLESPSNVVHDRLFAGELVYGPICRGKDRLTIDGLNLFQRIISSKPIFQFFCITSREVLSSNFHQKMLEENNYVKTWDQFYKICDSYWSLDRIMKWSLFDYTRHNIGYILGVVDNSSYRRYLPTGTVGSPLATHLFVGDQPNHESIDVPFHALNGSSGYLNQAIKLAGLQEEEIALSNAYGPRKSYEHSLLAILEGLPHLKHIFLMGNAATYWFNKRVTTLEVDERSRFKTHLIYHPSYLKRFFGNNPQDMAETIRGELYGHPDSR